MGAVTRRTGISEHTLRAWERRFDFPKPVRLPSGHRRFTSDQVRQLLLINKALHCGYRAGDVVPLPPDRIEALVRECDESASDIDPQVASRRWVEAVLQDAKAFDGSSIRMKMASEAATLGVGRFLRERAVPLIEELGEAWARGDIRIRHEHFVSEILGNTLRALRTPLDASAVGRPVVLACLPEEMHVLGLQMVAAELAATGRNHFILGPHTPIEEIVATAESLKAAAVGLSISAFAPGEPTQKLIKMLRAELPKTIPLWVGGGGAAALESLPKGVQQLSTLDEVAEAVRALAD
jgi:DNA-binding transcriptional MerR regulator/methylmalonyl-CoA mutase cobalamin-binding subunit